MRHETVCEGSGSAKGSASLQKTIINEVKMHGALEENYSPNPDHILLY